MNSDVTYIAEPAIEIVKKDDAFTPTVILVKETGGVFIYKFSILSGTKKQPGTFELKWKLPSINIKGVWKSGGLHDKRQQYDWELNHVSSRISVNAPIISVFGHDDKNIITFACSDAVNFMEMNALLREEDNHLYCHLSFFKERHPAIQEYTTYIRIDTRSVGFNQSIKEVASWWETFEELKPISVPPLARTPLYSTWYQFHQNLDEKTLLEECKIAVDLGYKLIILDDGWQTMDTNRGYDYTGDWEPDRFPDMANFVAKFHQIGMQFGLWFSVPFCGKKSKAYKKFKGKFLTEDHRWAPVFDPRYPEVRQYLMDIYTHALRDWKLDAFKLDFIDDFKVYPDTILTKENGRDYANVNEAVDRLMTDVMLSLRAIKPDIAIEFRQQYIGPAMRKFGNMFRAFDCPNDAVSNRIRTADVKLLCGQTAVHSDPQTWNANEPVDLAALQVLNGFFAVPQMSVNLVDLPVDHLKMIRFYNNYWRENAAVIMDGKFTAKNPLANYPILQVEKDGHCIMGIYEDVIVDCYDQHTIDMLNAKRGEQMVIRNHGGARRITATIWNAQGEIITSSKVDLPAGLSEMVVPVSGMLRMVRV